MANINLQQFIGDLRREFLSVYNNVSDVTVEAAFDNAAVAVLARQIDGGGGGQDGRQLSLPLSRGQKAAQTRKKNQAKAARAANSGAGAGSIGTGDGAQDSPNA